MALNVKQKYPGTQGGAAQLYGSDTRLSLRRRELFVVAVAFVIRLFVFRHHETSSSIFILPCIFFVSLFLPSSVDATWRLSSSLLRMCARQDCFVFKRPQVVFYCNFSCSRHVSKSANLIGCVKPKKQTPGVFLKMTLLRMAFFASVCTLTLVPFV